MAKSEHRDWQLSAWHQYYDHKYRTEPADLDSDTFAGWLSSYTSEPLPTEELVEWRTAVVDLVLAGRPKRVLDVACGSGMLTAAVAAQCEEYWGTDVAQSAVDVVAERIAEYDPELARRVTLRCQEAVDMTGLPEAYFDTIVITTTVQYFPDLDYLLDTITGLVRRLAPGGRLVLTDLRDLRTFEHLATGSWLQRTAAEEPAAADILERVRATAGRNAELLIHPGLFAQLPGIVPAVTAAEVRAKRGWSRNESTRHRYDAVIHTGPVVADLAEIPELAWTPGFAIDAALADRPEVLAVTGIPNARIAGEVTARAYLAADDRVSALAALHKDYAGTVDPEALWQAGEALGYRTLVSPSLDDVGAVDAYYVRAADPTTAVLRQSAPAGTGLSAYANVPAPFPQAYLPQPAG